MGTYRGEQRFVISMLEIFKRQNFCEFCSLLKIIIISHSSVYDHFTKPFGKVLSLKLSSCELYYMSLLINICTYVSVIWSAMHHFD